MLAENILKHNKRIGFDTNDFQTGAIQLQGLFLVFCAIKKVYENDEQEEFLCDFIKTGIESIIPARAPAFDNGHNWGYPILCSCLVLIANNEKLWNLFDKNTQDCIHECMRMFALMWNFGCNERNDFKTGIGLHGNYRKCYVGTNYLLTNNALILLLDKYFGGIQELNGLYKAVEYDTQINRLRDLQLLSAYKTWTTPGVVDKDGTLYPGARELFAAPQKTTTKYRKRLGDSVILADGGKGLGCKISFGYRPISGQPRIETALGIFEHILKTNCFIKTCVSSVNIPFEDDFSAHIADGTVSPYEGQYGMFSEFDGGNEANKRSSIFHCEIDFMILMCYFETMRLLNIAEPSELSCWDAINVGMEDFIYKREHGYIGYSMYHIEELGKWDLDSSLAIQLWKEEYRTNKKEG